MGTFGQALFVRWCCIYYIMSVILFLYNGYVTTASRYKYSTYYVSAGLHGVPCKHTERPCHDLSFYVRHHKHYFSTNTIFHFLEGIHTLDHPLRIKSVSKLTLQGQGHIVQGFHDTVKQSTSIITCNNLKGGIVFDEGTHIVLKFLTIVKCGLSYQKYKLINAVSLVFIDSHTVTLESVSVQNSSGLGLYLFNTVNVLIAKSTFANNQHPKKCQKCFGGNAVIDYLYKDATKKRQVHTLDIVKSNFTFGLNHQDCFISEVSNMRSSGGLSIFLHHKKNLFKVLVSIDSVVFYSNSGEVGANFLFRARKGHYHLVVRNTISMYGKSLISKHVCAYGPGMALLTDDYDPKSKVIIENSHFLHNVATQYGGGIYIYMRGGSSSIEFHKCMICNNTAYIAGTGLFLHEAFGGDLSSHFYLKDVLFDSNNVPKKFGKTQSALTLINIRYITFEQTQISNHDTTGLFSYNSLLTFHKNNIFLNNSGVYGGGIALYDSSSLIIKDRISFVNNHASISGGGIFVSLVINVKIPVHCFFLFHSRDGVLDFVNNTADVSGDVMYGGNINDGNCNDFDHHFHYPKQKGLSVVSSDAIELCFCKSERPDCSIKKTSVNTMPGININIQVAAVGIKNGLTSGVLKLTDTLTNVQVDDNRLNVSCNNITFRLKANSSLHATTVFGTLESSVDPVNDPLHKVLEVAIKSCPTGFPLVNDSCACRTELTNSPTITCDVNTQVITREKDMWIGYSGCLIVYKKCPLDYCNHNNVSFKFTIPSKQCLLNRSGLLCGKCAEGLSLVLGSNKCKECNNYYLGLIIPFAVAGIALIAFIIALNLTVSVGTINGLIFYANVVKLYEPLFFPYGPVTFVTPLISWLNLDLGIETCFYNSMNSCQKEWLQFIFPAYVWFLLILITIMSNYSSAVVRLVGSHVIQVLATVILLSYTKIIRIVFQALHFINVECSGENNVTTLLRLYIDPNVQYLRGCHLPLFLFSLAVLILLIVPYTFFLLAIPLLEGPLSKYICCCRKLSTYTKPFFDAYGGPYKDKCRFWTGFLLLVRVILAVVVSLDTQASVSLDVLTSLLIAITVLYFLLKGIYQNIILACLELFFVYNLMLMVYTNPQISSNNESKEKVSSSTVLVLLAFAIFCGIILYHVWYYKLNSCLRKPIRKFKKIFKRLSSPPISNDEERPLIRPGSPAIVCETSSVSVVSVLRRRESLLADEDD